MTTEQLEGLFFSHGYDKIPSNLPEFVFYCHRELQGVNVMQVIDYRQGLYISEDQYFHLKEKIIDFFRQKGEKEVHVMTLILCTDSQKARKLCLVESFCWIIDTMTNRLIIHESQVSDFYGWKGILEDYLYALARSTKETTVKEPQMAVHTDKWDRQKIGRLPMINIILVAVNVILFLICTFTGDLLYNKGALSVMYIVEDKAYYRAISSMFLHWDVGHLFSNMIVLYYVGEIVERRVGHVPYAVLYFLSGLAGNLFSMGYELFSGKYYLGEHIISVGASGAVFGVEGALLLLVLMHHGRLESMTMGRVTFAVAFSLYCGFTSTNVNNAAHVGGVLMGFAAAAVICLMFSHGRMRKDKNL